MIVSILLALLATVIILALAKLVERKLSPNPIPGDWVWCVWVIAVILIIVAWWRMVLGDLVGPMP